MTPVFRFAAAALLAVTLPAAAALAQSYGPLDGRVGGPVDNRAPGIANDNRAPSGYTASRTECFKDGLPVAREFCESDPFYRPDRVPGLDYRVQRCSTANATFNPVTRSYQGLDGITRYCN